MSIASETQQSPVEHTFLKYEALYKALGDKQRLIIMHELSKHGKICVCDMCGMLDMPQSKLSYHLKILLDADLIERQTSGTWNYYQLNKGVVNHVLTEELREVFCIA